MSKILDLNVFVQETLGIRMPGEEKPIQLKKPTRETVIHLAAFQGMKPIYDEENAKSIDDIILEILNTNIEGRVFEADYVENGLILPMRMAIIEAYSAWIVGIEKNPN